MRTDEAILKLFTKGIHIVRDDKDREVILYITTYGCTIGARDKLLERKLNFINLTPQEIKKIIKILKKEKVI